MEYFIHPLWFYVIDLMDTLTFLPLLIFLFGGLFLIIALFFADPINETQIKAFYKHLAKPIIIVFIISSLIALLAPSSSACYKMMAASIVTPDNVEIAADGIIELIEDITEIFEENSETEE